MSPAQIASLSLLCCEATGLVEIPNSNWPSTPVAPIGDVPGHWADGVHNEDGHGMWDDSRNLEGEKLLSNELGALYVKDGLEYATDDVSNAWLDPALVAAARKVEMKFFEDMKVYDRVDRAEMHRRGQNHKDSVDRCQSG